MQEFTVVLDAEKKFKTAVSFIVHVYILSHHRPMLHFVFFGRKLVVGNSLLLRDSHLHQFQVLGRELPNSRPNINCWTSIVLTKACLAAYPFHSRLRYYFLLKNEIRGLFCSKIHSFLTVLAPTLQMGL